LIGLAIAITDVPLKTDTDKAPLYTSHTETPPRDFQSGAESSPEPLPVPVVVTVAESRALPAVPFEPRPSVSKDRVTMSRQLQTELKRVGCYHGDVTGVWTRESREAMRTFIDRANARLPIDEPDGIQLTLLRTYDGKVCGERCPAGQGLSHTGGCVPHAILALTSEVKRVPTAASAPAGRATPAIIGWTTSVAGAALIPPPETVPVEALAGPPAPVAAPTPTKAAKAGAAEKRRYAERGGGWARNLFKQLDRLGFN
jgi:hypothetical protein